MPRFARLTGRLLFYHIINRGIEKRNIFKQKVDYLKFLEYLKRYKDKFDWIIYCYCLLPNHFHLLIQTKEHPLGLIMKSLQTAYGVYFNKKYKRVGPVFAGRYKSIICQKDEYLQQVSKYIHLNPVKANLSNSPLSYPYSSFQEYIKGANTHTNINIIDKRVMKIFLGENIDKGIKGYKSFVEEKDDLFEYEPNIDVFGNTRFTTKHRKIG